MLVQPSAPGDHPHPIDGCLAATGLIIEPRSVSGWHISVVQAFWA